MPKTAVEIIEDIRKVFPLRPVPDSGLFAAQAGDAAWLGQITDEEAEAMAARDQRRPWNEYCDDDLRALDAAMSHQVAEGFVYFLPAYLCAALRLLSAGELDEMDQFVNKTTFQVTERDPYNLSRLKLLTQPQRAAVIDFLEFVAAHADEFEADIARKALDRFWLKPDQPTIIVP